MIMDVGKVKYCPGTGAMVYRSNGKPYTKDDAIYLAWELSRGYPSDKPLGLVNPNRGLVFDNIIQIETPVELPEGISEISKGLYQVEWENTVYGSYRDLGLAKKTLEKVKQGCYRRRREYLLSAIRILAGIKYASKD